MSTPEQRPELRVTREARPSWITVVVTIALAVIFVILLFLLGPCPPGKPVPAGAPADDGVSVIHRADP